MTQPHAPAGRVDDLIVVAQRLSDLASAEIAALRTMRPQDIRPMQEEKAQLASLYETEMRALKENTGALHGLHPSQFSALEQATHGLRDVLAENKRALEAAREINQKIIHVIAEEVARQRNPAGSYGQNGRMQQPRNGRQRQAGPLRLDRHV